MENRMLEHAISPSSASGQPRSLLHRRSLLIGAGAAGMVLGITMGRAYTQIAKAPDYSLRIAPLRLELAPGEGDPDFHLQRSRARSGIPAARRQPSQHRYP